MVEQINLPDQYLLMQSGRQLPLEVHSYFLVSPDDRQRDFELRFSLVADTGLETLGAVQKHQAKHERFRLRSFGLPLPPVYGAYTLRVDVRVAGSERWQRQAATWPLRWVSVDSGPRITH